MEQGIGAINEQVKQESEFVRTLVGEIGKVIVGQKYLIERLLIGLLADGHVLLEQGRRVPHQEGARVRQPHSGGRNQPRAGEGAERVA
jgi:hypothetical protein